MLLQFRFKNFMSFAEEVVFDMTATSIREHANSLLDVNGNKVLPVAAIYGGNASGKSNFFQAYKYMTSWIKEDYNTAKNFTQIQMSNFIFDDINKNEAVEFEACIVVKDLEYRYGFACKQEEIGEEWLFERKYRKGPQTKEKCIFYRCDKEIELKTSDTKEKKEIEYIFSMVRKDELILTSLGKRKVSRYAELYSALTHGLVVDFSSDTFEDAMKVFAIRQLYKDEEKFEKVKEVIRVFDPDIQDIEILKEQDKGLEEVYNVYTYHKKGDGDLVRTSIDFESRGTRKFFSLLYYLVLALRGGVLFVDELDSKLHPLILRYIVRMFTNPEVNTGGGQLIFSSHNLICLDSSDLRRDEIWFVEKNNQRSTMFSLYDFKMEDSSVRSDMNFGKNYLSGRFGAIPFQKRED